MSQPSHFHEMLVANISTTGHHARAMSPSHLLKEKAIRRRQKTCMGLETFSSMTGANHPLQRHPHVSHAFPCYHCMPFLDIPYPLNPHTWLRFDLS
jgi:hypothetical protein